MPTAAVNFKPLWEMPPEDHVRLIHPEGRRGNAAFAQVTREKWKERVVSLDDLPFYAREMAGQTDTYLSQQSFYGWRRIAGLAQLGAAYVDLDFHRTKGWADRPADVVTSAVLCHLRDSDLPTPSYVLSTGRGLVCVWLHDLVPRRALPRWQAIQHALAGSLKEFGADMKALDAARVFRIAGTTNSKADATVRPTFIGDTYRWDFEDFAREVLPVERGQLIMISAERARRRAERETVAPAMRLTAATYWETVLSDLQKLRRLRWFGELPPGNRDTWLFLACNAMSWLAPPAAMIREINALSAECAGWTDKETKSRMNTVVRRAQMAIAGETIEWNGVRVDPRYRFRSETIVNWLEIEPEEMRRANLRTLVDDTIKRELATQRETDRRRRNGSASREEQRQERLKLGFKAMHLTVQEGLSQREAAEDLGVSLGQLNKAIREYRKSSKP